MLKELFLEIQKLLTNNLSIRLAVIKDSKASFFINCMIAISRQLVIHG